MAVNLWHRVNGRAVLHSSYASHVRELHQTFQELREAGGRPVIRPDTDSRAHVERAMRELDLHDLTSRERRGEGPHPLSPGQFNMTVHPHHGLPRNVEEAHDLVGPNGMYAKNDRDEGGPWTYSARPHTISPDLPLHTAQQHISGTHVERGVARLRGGQHPLRATDPYSGVKVFQDDEGKHWVMDGHHRIAIARSAGRPVRGRLMEAGGLQPWREAAQEAHEDYEAEHQR